VEEGNKRKVEYIKEKQTSRVPKNTVYLKLEGIYSFHAYSIISCILEGVDYQWYSSKTKLNICPSLLVTIGNNWKKDKTNKNKVNTIIGYSKIVIGYS
jgi:hypothetical protein